VPVPAVPPRVNVAAVITRVARTTFFIALGLLPGPGQ